MLWVSMFLAGFIVLGLVFDDNRKTGEIKNNKLKKFMEIKNNKENPFD